MTAETHEKPIENTYDNPNSLENLLAKNASQWNSQLNWGRKDRGPQWDWATGIYQVPVSSPEYYAHPVRLPENQLSSLPVHLKVDPNGVAAAAASQNASTPKTNADSTYESGRPRRTRNR